MFGKCMVCSLLIFNDVLAEGVSARLRFLVWQPDRQQGFYIAGSHVEAEPSLDDVLLLGENKQLVNVSDKWCTKRKLYKGAEVVQLMRGSRLVSQFSVHDGGDYYILLHPKGSGYEALPIELSELQNGNVLVVNLTSSSCRLRQTNADEVIVPEAAWRIMSCLSSDTHGIHLTVHRAIENEWKPEFARHYSMKAESKSLCLLYVSPGYPHLQLKLLSGL